MHSFLLYEAAIFCLFFCADIYYTHIFFKIKLKKPSNKLDLVIENSSCKLKIFYIEFY